jgi:hypothetical protein
LGSCRLEYRTLILKYIYESFGKKNIQIRKTSLKEETDVLKNTTAAGRWAMMWRLALGAWVIKGEPVAESRLQRNIVRVYRRA